MPSKSKKQRNLWGAAYGAKKGGRKKPPYVPSSMWKQPMTTMREFTVKKKKKNKGKK